MKNLIFGAIVASLATSVFAISPVAAGSDKDKCIAMVKKMVGVEPSEKVMKLCADGKSKQAMEAAMMGD